MSKLRRVLVEFLTPCVSLEPETVGPFAGCPRYVQSKLSRYFVLDTSNLWIFHNVVFYGDEYKITRMALNQSSIGIIISEEEMSNLVVKARSEGHRWRRGVCETTDARRLLMRISL